MIKNSAQEWEVGKVVKVGFMGLVVAAKIPTPHDYMPDAYLLSNIAGDKAYKFVPHHGIERITKDEAIALLDQARKVAEVAAAQALAKAMQVDGFKHVFGRME